MNNRNFLLADAPIKSAAIGSVDAGPRWWTKRMTPLKFFFVTAFVCFVFSGCTQKPSPETSPAASPATSPVTRNERVMAAPASTIIIRSDGTRLVTGNPTCGSGGIEVQVAISGGAANNSIDGIAICGRNRLPAVNAIDPGNGQQGSNTDSGLQGSGTAGCDSNYRPVGQDSTWSVVCKFF